VIKKGIILSIFCSFFLSLHYGLAQSPLSKTIDFSVNDQSISNALIQLSEVSGVDIAFSNQFFKKQSNISIQVTGQTVEYLLNEILATTSIGYKVIGNRILLYKEKPTYFTISGYIQDKESGERLLSATVYCPGLQRGTTTNEYGFYSLTLPKTTTDVTFSYLGYERQTYSIVLDKNIQKNIQLNSSILLAEVIVTPENTGSSYTHSTSTAAATIIDKSMLSLSPSLGGEADPIRTAQLLAGVHSGADGLDGIFVRGGDNGQNLMLLDGVPVYIPYHLLGIFSVYNQHTINTAKVYKGGFPARYGGRLSSVFDIRTREGNQYEWGGHAAANLISTNALLEGPIKKGKGAVLFAGRTAHSSFLLRPFFQETYFNSGSEDIRAQFLDYNLKANYTFSSKDRLYLSHYRGFDFMGGNGFLEKEDSIEEENVELNWSNSITALRWNHLFSNKLFANTTITYSRFDFEYAVLEQFRSKSPDEGGEVYFISMRSDNQDLGVKLDFDYFRSAQHHIRFGGGMATQQFAPGLTVVEEEDEEFEEIENVEIEAFNQFENDEEFDALEAYLYLENQFTLSEAWSWDIGLRMSSFFSGDANYNRFEPRISTAYQLSDKWRTSLSFSRMVQYLHLVSYSTIRLPNDLWVPSDEELLPEEAWQGEIGIGFQLNRKTSLHLDAYYKLMDNLYTYDDEYEFQVEDFQSFLTRGSGEAMGLEFSTKYDGEKQGVQFSYALTRASRQFDDINEGESFPHVRNQPHQIKLFAYQRLAENLNLSINWIYNSAGPAIEITPLSGFEEENEPASDDEIIANPEQLEDYHRLDINLEYQLATSRATHTFKLGTYNLYDRANLAYFRFDFEEEGQLFYRPVYGIPFRPSFSYRINF
jgi:outer membrane receptor protein involved in Fe transport